MSDVWGKNIQFSIFGESHGPAIGGVLSSLPAGAVLDFAAIDRELARRNHRAFYSTSRAEPDSYEILSGVYEGKTTGSALAFLIRNQDTRSKDYPDLNRFPRPGHADYPAAVKYHGANDYRGGGHFSGRLTAPLVFAGAVAKQLLPGVRIYAHIQSVGSVSAGSVLDMPNAENLLCAAQKSNFAVWNGSAAGQMREEIQQAKSECDSVGGVVECVIFGLTAGIGEPFFGSVESELAHMLFSIPAVKGIEFGLGFDISRLRGSQANDGYRMEDGCVTAESNNNGGITGGITNGMPVVFRVAVKPTPSIFKRQNTVDLAAQENTDMALKGRHDACIVPRAVPVVEAAAALVLLDLMGGGMA
mgnify:FL=1